MSISANESIRIREAEEWKDMMDAWMDDHQQAVNHLAFGFDIDQRRKARGLKGKSSVPTWV